MKEEVLQKLLSPQYSDTLSELQTVYNRYEMRCQQLREEYGTADSIVNDDYLSPLYDILSEFVDDVDDELVDYLLLNLLSQWTVEKLSQGGWTQPLCHVIIVL